MKIGLCFLVIGVLVLAIEAVPAPNRQKRGFRSGAGTRFSHGYGKRNDGFPYDYNTKNSKHIFTTDELAQLLTKSDELAKAFVETYIDTN
ncbi:unnamed protein product, partial [Owenia fusiformis]